MNSARTIVSILDDVEEAASEKGSVSVDDVVQSIGDRAYGPLIMLPALLEITPIGALPLVPSFLALLIVIFAGQVALGRKCLWLPEHLGKRSAPAERVEEARKKLQSIAQKLDDWFRYRLPWLTSTPSTRFAAGCCILLCLTVPPLEIVPFASTLPMAAIAVFGLAMTVRDGLLMLLAYLLMGAAVTGAVFIAAST